jgi:predicted transcriptional regulator
MQAPRLSKLEIYLEILKIIEGKKPTKLEAIKKRTNLDDDFVNHAVDFLERQNLVEKRTFKDNTTYKSTDRGERLSRYFTELAQNDLFMLHNSVTCKERY